MTGWLLLLLQIVMNIKCGEGIVHTIFLIWYCWPISFFYIAAGQFIIPRRVGTTLLYTDRLHAVSRSPARQLHAISLSSAAPPPRCVWWWPTTMVLVWWRWLWVGGMDEASGDKILIHFWYGRGCGEQPGRGGCVNASARELKMCDKSCGLHTSLVLNGDADGPCRHLMIDWRPRRVIAFL